MLNNGNKQECHFKDDIVAYIYDEIGQSDRGKFESHLAGCTACTDEFAGISNARFSVFEWRREEFAHLSTPEIVIPYAPKKSEAAAVGFFTGLRDLLTLSSWSSAVMVAGAVIICIGLGFVVLNNVGNGSQVAGTGKPVVTEQAVPPVTAPNQPEVAVVPTLPSQKESNLNGTSITASNKATPNREIIPVRATMQTRRIRYEKNLTAGTQTVRPLVQQKRNAPALTTYAEDDDKSLRLADLFDEGGS